MKTVVLLCGLPLCLSLAGDWAAAKAALRSADCCVVSVSGLEPHLRVLQARWTAARNTRIAWHSVVPSTLISIEN